MTWRVWGACPVCRHSRPLEYHHWQYSEEADGDAKGVLMCRACHHFTHNGKRVSEEPSWLFQCGLRLNSMLWFHYPLSPPSVRTAFMASLNYPGLEVLGWWARNPISPKNDLFPADLIRHMYESEVPAHKKGEWLDDWDFPPVAVVSGERRAECGRWIVRPILRGRAEDDDEMVYVEWSHAVKHYGLEADPPPWRAVRYKAREYGFADELREGGKRAWSAYREAICHIIRELDVDISLDGGGDSDLERGGRNPEARVTGNQQVLEGDGKRVVPTAEGFDVIEEGEEA